MLCQDRYGLFTCPRRLYLNACRSASTSSTRKPEATLKQERFVQGMKKLDTWYKPATKPVKNLSHRCALLRREGALAARARPGLFAGFLGIFSYVIVYSLSKVQLIPKNHPYLYESMSDEH